ncbi:MAG: hypothetical protein KDK39_17785 [Leptospiraceae bacterium]|nr:hypothetical protein [Leptospiraceae bacterium]
MTESPGMQDGLIIVLEVHVCGLPIKYQWVEICVMTRLMNKIPIAGIGQGGSSEDCYTKKKMAHAE